jgi:hypothetical protein
LNFTDEAPVKFAPLIVTLVPFDPLFGVKLEMLGEGGGVEPPDPRQPI